jgi:hypothetical protein
MKTLPRASLKHCVLVYQLIDNQLVVVKTSIFDNPYSAVRFANELTERGYYAIPKTKVIMEQPLA